jgi:hypothetical protein
MLPLRPTNNWKLTIYLCGGNDMPTDAYGNYSFPMINTFYYPASRDCQRMTPEPTDSSPVIIILPDGKLLVINGARNGTVGYAVATWETPTLGQMLYTKPV